MNEFGAIFGGNSGDAGGIVVRSGRGGEFSGNGGNGWRSTM
jgi:hypothetical protein